MGKLYDFLMEGEAAAQETAEVHISGFPHPFSSTLSPRPRIRPSARPVRR